MIEMQIRIPYSALTLMSLMPGAVQAGIITSDEKAMMEHALLHNYGPTAGGRFHEFRQTDGAFRLLEFANKKFGK